MRISGVASRAGVNVQTLRYYERVGLLHQPDRTHSGYRSYGPDSVRTVRFVKRAQALGFSLDDVRSLLELAEGGPQSCEAARQMAEYKILRLDRKIQALHSMRESLSQLVDTCHRPQPQRVCPLLQAIEDEAWEEPNLPGDEVVAEVNLISHFDGFELLPDVVRLLAGGHPIQLQDVAKVAGRPVGEIEELLKSQPGTDWDDEGLLVGFGLTQRPTPHRFILDDQVLYAWCATDTLFFPVILGRSARVESSCPDTGQPIRLAVSPEAVKSIDPPTTVVSQLHHPEVDDIRASVCRHGHFFSSPGAASSWTAEHPEGQLRSVDEAFQLARAACEELGWSGSVRTER